MTTPISKEQAIEALEEHGAYFAKRLGTQLHTTGTPDYLGGATDALQLARNALRALPVLPDPPEPRNATLTVERDALGAKIDEAVALLKKRGISANSATTWPLLAEDTARLLAILSPSTPPPADNFAHISDALELRITSQNEALTVVDSTGATWTKVADIDRATLTATLEAKLDENWPSYRSPEQGAAFDEGLMFALDLIAQGGEPAEVTHACPIGDAGTTPCCDRTPFELSRTDRMTLDDSLVTCRVQGGEPAEPRLTRERLDALIEKTLATSIYSCPIEWQRWSMEFLRDALLADSPEPRQAVTRCSDCDEEIFSMAEFRRHRCFKQSETTEPSAMDEMAAMTKMWIAFNEARPDVSLAWFIQHYKDGVLLADSPEVGETNVLNEISDERVKQDEKWGEQNHPSGTGNLFGKEADRRRTECQLAFQNGYGTWMHILDEEIWESYAEEEPAKLRAELIQSAAVIVAWIECIDRRGPLGESNKGEK